jgi:hypothetical protein
MTIKHNQADIGDINIPNAPENIRKTIWFLALFVDEEEKDKLGRSFNPFRTRFNIVKGEIFVSFTVS